MVVLDNGQIPEGTRVQVTVPEEAKESLRDMLLRFAGTCPGLPSNLAEQHDHYIHGTPKR